MHRHADGSDETGHEAAIGGGGPAPDGALRADLLAELRAAAVEAAAASTPRHRSADPTHGEVLARWETQRRRRGPIHWLAMSCPFFGPVLVGVATAVWIYVLLALARHLLVG